VNDGFTAIYLKRTLVEKICLSLNLLAKLKLKYILAQ